MGNYYLDTVCGSLIGSNASPPVSQGEDVTSVSAGTLLWVGVRLSISNPTKNATAASVITLEVRKDGGGWQTLAASDLAPPGTGNMNYTDLTPSNTDWWLGSVACGGYSPGDPGAAEDNDATLTTDAVSAGEDTECWWAIDTTGGGSSSTYEFAIYDGFGEFGSSGAGTLLACSITMAAGATQLVVADSGHDNVVTPTNLTLTEVLTLTVADCYHVLSDPGPLTITHIVPVVPNDAYHDNVVTPITANFLLTVTPTVNDAFSVLEDPGPLALGVHLTVNSGSSVVSDGGPISITEKKTLSINSAYHETQDGGPLTLTQIKTLVVEDCFSLTEDVGPISLTEINILTCADCNHDLIDPGPITLSVAGAIQLVVADAFHLTEDPGPLALTVHLVVADSGHDVESPQINITSGQSLVVADAYHVLEDTGPVSLTQKHNLTVADAFDVLEDTGPFALTQTHILILSDCENAVESPQINLVSGLQLAVSDAYHEHLSSAISLSQIHDLALNSAYHQHDLEGDLVLTTTGPAELVVSASEHTLTDDLSAITQLHILAINSCENAVVSAQITITHVLPSALGDIVEPSIRSLTTDRFLVSLTTERTIHHS